MHHSHVTGTIQGYVHDFSNEKVGENQLGFDVWCIIYLDLIYFFINWYKTFSLIKINIGASNLSNINFANIDSQIKFIGTMKYYQKILAP